MPAAADDFWRENHPPQDDLTVELPFARRIVPAEQPRLQRPLVPESQDDKWVGIPRPEGLDLHRAGLRRHIFRVLLRNEGDDWIAERLLVSADVPFERYHRQDWAVPLVASLLSRWIESP